jgi:nitrate reductase NapE component
MLRGISEIMRGPVAEERCSILYISVCVCVCVCVCLVCVFGVCVWCVCVKE